MSGRLLIVDAGHSRLKLHAYADGRVSRSVTAARPFDWPASVDVKIFDECLLMGTHERLLRNVSSYLNQSGGPRPALLGSDLRVPLESLSGLKGVGNDRLAQALGAAQKFPGRSCLVVSAGTALVVDILQRDGRFAGGLIAAGWHASQKAWTGTAPQLRLDPAEVISADYPGKNTAEALWLGWLLPAVSMIQSLSQKHEVEKVVLTGGEAGLLEKHLPTCEVVEHLGADAMARSLGYFTPPL